MKSNLIASCGMNCGIYKGYLREKNKCLGCNSMDEGKPESCRKCVIKNCEELNVKRLKFCSSKCKKYPCKRLRDLDKRYRDKYSMSMLKNLEFIKKNGLRNFIIQQKKKYLKNKGVFCIHDKKLYPQKDL
jgi:hypothetical protein